MGRYIFFNTNLEHTFKFGIQPSSDIQEFAGDDTSNTYEYSHNWIQDDKSYIFNHISFLEINFENYEKNLDGTHNLRSDLYNINIDCKYILGCLIYHQLLYTDILRCHYDG